MTDDILHIIAKTRVLSSDFSIIVSGLGCKNINEHNNTICYSPDNGAKWFLITLRVGS